MSRALLKQRWLFHYCVSRMCACFLVCHCWLHWHSEDTGVAKVVPSKAGLVTQLFLNPERKRRECRAGGRMWKRTTADETKRKEEEKYKSAISDVMLYVLLYIHTNQAGNTHLMSWLYLARRSDRQGAPVLIWRETKSQRVRSTVALLPTCKLPIIFTFKWSFDCFFVKSLSL